MQEALLQKTEARNFSVKLSSSGSSSEGLGYKGCCIPFSAPTACPLQYVRDLYLLLNTVPLVIGMSGYCTRQFFIVADVEVINTEDIDDVLNSQAGRRTFIVWRSIWLGLVRRGRCLIFPGRSLSHIGTQHQMWIS